MTDGSEATIETIQAMSISSEQCDAGTQTDQNNNTSFFSPSSRSILQTKVQTIQKIQPPPTSGIWIQADRKYSGDSEFKLPRRVNHASAFEIVGDKIYILGGFHQFSQHANYQYAAKLDCYEFNCKDQKSRIIHKAERVQEELSNLDIALKGKPLSYPLMRYGLQAVQLNGKIYLFGGVADAEILRQYIFWINFNDVFCLDLTQKPATYSNLTNTTIEAFFNFDDSNVGPTIRDGHSIAPLPDANSFVIFGGYVHGMEKMANDLWIYSVELNKWMEIKLHQDKPTSSGHNTSFEQELAFQRETAKNEPMPRDFSTIVVLGDDLILYGGRSFNVEDEEEQNDVDSIYDERVWVVKNLFRKLNKGNTAQEFDEMLNFAEQKCKWQGIGRKETKPNEEPLPFPTPRRSHMFFIRNNEMYLTGGVDKHDHHHNDIWRFDLPAERWHKVQCYSSQRPVARRRGTCLWNKELDMMFQICGTRLPANSSEIDYVEQMRKSNTFSLGQNNENKESKDILLEVDDFSTFAFDINLKNIATFELVRRAEQEAEKQKSSRVVSKLQSTIENSGLYCVRERFKVLLNEDLISEHTKKSERQNQIG